MFATSISNKDREAAEKMESEQGKSKGKGNMNMGVGKGCRTGREFHGVGMVLNRKKATLALRDLEQIDGRVMRAESNCKHNKMCLINAYAPQRNRPTREKDKFYDELQEVSDASHKDDINIIC